MEARNVGTNNDFNEMHKMYSSKYFSSEVNTEEIFIYYCLPLTHNSQVTLKSSNFHNLTKNNFQFLSISLEVKMLTLQ